MRHRGRTPSTRSAGSTCPTATPGPSRCASSSPTTRSPGRRKLEGQWWADGGAYFVSSFARTPDGSVNEHDGQVWFYDPKSRTIRLKTIFGVNPDPATGDVNFDGPDNITVSPHGGLILAEDGEGRSHLVGVTRPGRRPTRWPATC